MIFKNSKVYDVLKWIGATVLPALGVFSVTIGEIWNVSQIAIPIGGTFTALGILLSVCLGISSIKYKTLNEKGENKNG